MTGNPAGRSPAVPAYYAAGGATPFAARPLASLPSEHFPGAGNSPMTDAGAALLNLLRFCETTERTRSRVEAPWEKTDRLLHLTTAWALIRVGDAAAHEALIVPARVALHGGDEVERRVAVLFDARLDEARQGATPSTPPSSLADGLESFLRYKLDRILGSSQVLSPWQVPDAIGGFWRDPRSAPELLRPPRKVQSVDTAEALSIRLEEATRSQNWVAAAQTHSECLRGAAHLGLSTVLAGIETVKQAWPRVTDSFNTNSHWCLTAVCVFDAMAFAIAEAVNPLAQPAHGGS